MNLVAIWHFRSCSGFPICAMMMPVSLQPGQTDQTHARQQRGRFMVFERGAKDWRAFWTTVVQIASALVLLLKAVESLCLGHKWRMRSQGGRSPQEQAAVCGGDVAAAQHPRGDFGHQAQCNCQVHNVSSQAGNVGRSNLRHMKTSYVSFTHELLRTSGSPFTFHPLSSGKEDSIGP